VGIRQLSGRNRTPRMFSRQLAVWRLCCQLAALVAICLPAAGCALELQVGPLVANAAGQTAPMSLETALAKIEALSTGTWPTEGVVVQLQAGVYRLDAPLRLNARSSGRVIAPLVFKGPAQGRAVLSGAISLGAFSPVGNDTGAIRVSETASGHVVQVQLASQGITDFGRLVRQGQGRDVQPAPMELFYRGEPMPLAQWPNAGYMPIADVGTNPDEATFSLKVGQFDAWAREPDLWMTGYWGQDWADEWIAVAAVDVQRRVIKLRDGLPLYGARVGQRVKVVNALSELDVPGEWYIDRAFGTLYFWPPGPLAAGDAEVSMLNTVMLIDGASHVHFDGIDFEGARGDAIVVTGGRDVRITRARIQNAGNRAVRMSGVEHQVVDSDIRDTGQGGISLWGGDRQTLVSGGLLAQGNRIQRFNRWGKTYRPAITLGGVGNIARGNLIFDGAHTGLLFYGNEHLIEFNEMHGLARETGDVGVIYTGRDWTARGTVIRHNFLHDVHGPGLHGSRGVYLDDQASGIVVQGNLFARVDQPLFIGGGRDNVIDNNLFVNSSPALHIDARGRTWQRKETEDPEGTLRKGLRQVPYQKRPYTDRYPGLAQLLERSPGSPIGNVVRRNVVIGGQALLAKDGADKDLEVDRLFGAGDAALADTAAANKARSAEAFALDPMSRALRDGFSPLPLKRMGCTGRRWANVTIDKRNPEPCEARQTR
jgi:hypothetical protein